MTDCSILFVLTLAVYLQTPDELMLATQALKDAKYTKWLVMFTRITVITVIHS